MKAFSWFMYISATVYICMQLMILFSESIKKISWKTIIWKNASNKFIRCFEYVLVVVFILELIVSFKKNPNVQIKCIIWISIITFFLVINLIPSKKNSNSAKKAETKNKRLVKVHNNLKLKWNYCGAIDSLAIIQGVVTTLFYKSDYRQKNFIEVIVFFILVMLISLVTGELIKYTYSYRTKRDEEDKSLRSVLCIMFLILMLLIITRVMGNSEEFNNSMFFCAECLANLCISIMYLLISFVCEEYLELGFGVDWKYAVCMLSIVIVTIVLSQNNSELVLLWRMAFISLIIGWITLMYIMLWSIYNGIRFEEKEKPIKRVKNRFIILNLMYAMIILFMLVLLCDKVDHHKAFDMKITYNSKQPLNYSFRLFYYVVISFTTIGYGDVTPLTDKAILVSMLIAITSVIFLVIFINNIMQEKENHAES